MTETINSERQEDASMGSNAMDRDRSPSSSLPSVGRGVPGLIGRLSKSERLMLEVLLRALLIVVVATWGRSVFVNDVETYFIRAQDIGFSYLPYRDFLWEYPPFAALLLVLIPLTGHSDAAFHVAFVALMTAIEFSSLVYLRRARPEFAVSVTKVWMAGVLPLSAIAYFRLDFVPMAAAVAAVLAIAKGRRYVAPTIIGFSAKLWPIIFVAAMIVQRRFRDAIVAVVGCVGVVGVWYAFSPSGFRDFLDFRAGSGFQVESIPGAILLLVGRKPSFEYGALIVSDSGWEWVQVLMTVLLVTLPLLGFVAALRRPTKTNLIALLGAMVAVALVSQRLLSPQFLVWLAPFVVWTWPHHRRPAVLFSVAAWLTVVMIECYGEFLRGNDFLVSLGIIRNALLVWLGVELACIAFRGEPRLTPTTTISSTTTASTGSTATTNSSTTAG